MIQLIVILLLSVVLNAKNALCSQCACAKEGVHVRNGAGVTHTILTTLATGHCLTFKGHRQTVDGASWVNVDYNGHDGWIHEGYVTISTCASHSTSTSNVQLPGCPHIITRAEWGARASTSALHPLTHTPNYMFIHHGASHPCFTKADCITQVKIAQNYYIDGRGYSDLGYSFVVGEDGNVYEVRGWNHVGAHTLHYNSVGLAICVLGDFTGHAPNAAALNTVKQMIACGLANGKLTSTYILRGHRDVGQTACPGTKLYELIKTWPHY